MRNGLVTPTACSERRDRTSQFLVQWREWVFEPVGGKSARRLKTEAFGTAALRDARAADIRANIAEGVPASRLPKAVASTSEDISDFTAAFASMPKKAVVSMKKIPSYCAQLKEDFASLFVRR